MKFDVNAIIATALGVALGMIVYKIVNEKVLKDEFDAQV